MGSRPRPSAGATRTTAAVWPLPMSSRPAWRSFLGVIVLGGDKVTLAFVAAIPLVVVVSKIGGLYDRDEHLLRKTTLDEAPALFQVATLYTLVDLARRGRARGGGPAARGRSSAASRWSGYGALLFVSMLVMRGPRPGRSSPAQLRPSAASCSAARRRPSRVDGKLTSRGPPTPRWWAGCRSSPRSGGARPGGARWLGRPRRW